MEECYVNKKANYFIYLFLLDFISIINIGKFYIIANKSCVEAIAK